MLRYARRLADQRTKENDARDEAVRKANKRAGKGRPPLWKRLTGRR